MFTSHKKDVLALVALCVIATLFLVVLGDEASSASKSRTKFSATYRLIVANGYGTSRRVVLRRPYPQRISGVRWRPGTKQLSYGYMKQSRPSPLYLMNADGGKRKVLHRSLWASPFYQWSPNGNKIAFPGGFFVIDADGRNLRRIVKSANLTSDFFWSQDSKRLVYSAYGRTKDRIVQINADGSGKRQMYAGNPHFLFDLSPNGRRVAVPGIAKHGSTIDIADSDGGGVQQIATTERPTGVQWSPDGTRLSFTTDNDDSTESLYVVGSNGSELRRIVSAERFYSFDDAPAAWWSPDGKRIAYISGTVSGPLSRYDTLHVVNVDDGTVNRLSGRRSTVYKFAWSPNGERIAYIRTKDSSRDPPLTDVLVVKTDGSKRRRLTPRNSESSDLAWSSDGEQLAFVNLWFKRIRSPKRK